MSSSEAKIAANRLNSSRSTGPRTPDGKEQSRRNGLKHGMAGQGIVIPEADFNKVEERILKLKQQLTPRTALGTILIEQMATLSIRMERGSRQEFAAIASRVRNAGEDFDQSRHEKAEALFDGLADNPRAHRRKLRAMPEGVELMIEAWYDLRGQLVGPKPAWAAANLALAASLMGIREDQTSFSNLGALSRAIWGDFEGLSEKEGAGLDDQARRGWARDRLIDRVDQEIANLEAHYETLDFDTIEKDHAGAGDRALFDPSREACLARRYESEARRGFFKAHAQFQQVEAEAAEQANVKSNTTSSVPKTTYEPLGSSREKAPTPPVGLASKTLWPATIDVSSDLSTVRGPVDLPISSIRSRPASV